MILKGRSQRRALFHIPASGLKYGFKTGKRCMEAHLIGTGDFQVTGCTAHLGWVGNQAFMGEFLVLQSAIAAVADNATNLAMGAFDKTSILHEDLFPYLQRR